MLREQREYLQTSSSAFDAGAVGEAKRLAVTIRVLVHDTDASKSLLEQLHLKSELLWIDSGEPINPNNLMSTPGLVLLEMNGAVGRYVPRVAAGGGAISPRLVGFPGWWTRPVTKLKSPDKTWSRKQFVLMLANKQGGAHVDPDSDSSYERLAKENGLGWAFGAADRGEWQPFVGDPVAASVRQIAQEVLDTLDNNEALLS